MEQTYFRWCKEYGGPQVDQAKRLKEREQENAKLKRLVANLSLDNTSMTQMAGSWPVMPWSSDCGVSTVSTCRVLTDAAQSAD